MYVIAYIMYMKRDNPTVIASRTYKVQLTLTMVAYAIVLFGGIFFVKHFGIGGWLRVVILMLPLVPVAFMLPAILGFMRGTDEFTRRRFIDSLAIAGGITAALSVTYGFLEIAAGLPAPSAWWTWMVVMFSWGIARHFVARQYE